MLIRDLHGFDTGDKTSLSVARVSHGLCWRLYSPRLSTSPRHLSE